MKKIILTSLALSLIPVADDNSILLSDYPFLPANNDGGLSIGALVDGCFYHEVAGGADGNGQTDSPNMNFMIRFL